MDRFGTAALPDMDRFGTAILPDMDRFATAILPDMDRFASITLPDVNLSSGYLAAVQEAVDQAAAFKIRFAPPV